MGKVALSFRSSRSSYFAAVRHYFFSSRRRHTRWNCDWSSDVCSSDLGILGPNGAGKTTTLEIIEGLRKPDSGQVTLLGESPWPRNPKVLPRIGVQLQASKIGRASCRERV